MQAHLPTVLGTGSSHCTAPGSAGAGMRRIRARRVRRTPTSSPQRLSFTRTRQQANGVRVLLWASSLQVADRRLQPASAEARGAQPRAEAGAPPAGGAGVWFEIRTVCAASDQASRLTNCAPTRACVGLFLAGVSADQSRTL